MTITQLVLTKDSELVQKAIYFITASHSMNIPPKMIMTCAAEDMDCDHPVCLLYGSQPVTARDGSQFVGLTPLVIAWQVGAWLIAHDWAYDEHETMRDGIRTKWYELAVHVLMS